MHNPWLKNGEYFKQINNINVFYIRNDREENVFRYEYVYENGSLTHIKEYRLSDDEKTMLIQNFMFKYNSDNNVIIDVLRDDSGYFGFENSYEKLKGNAELFEVRDNLLSYFMPMIIK